VSRGRGTRLCIHGSPMALGDKQYSGAVGGPWRRARWDEPVPRETRVPEVAKETQLTGTGNHLRLLKYLDPEQVKQYTSGVSHSVVRRNLESILGPEGRELWSTSYHYTLVRRRYSLEQLVEDVGRLIQSVLS